MDHESQCIQLTTAVLCIKFYWIIACYWSLKLRLSLHSQCPPCHTQISAAALSCSVCHQLSFPPSSLLTAHSWTNSFKTASINSNEWFLRLSFTWSELNWSGKIYSSQNHIFFLRLFSSVKFWGVTTPSSGLQKEKKMFFFSHNLQIFPENFSCPLRIS